MTLPNKIIAFAITLSSLFSLSSCTPKSSVTVEDFGHLPEKGDVLLVHLRNSQGASADVLNYGARLIRLYMPGSDGSFSDVVVGPDSLATLAYCKERFFGPILGRYGNRIDNAVFKIDSLEYHIVPNEEYDGVPVACHGGKEGFDRFIWETEPLKEKNRVGVRFHRISPDGEQGFPGTCDCYMTYWLTEDNILKLEYSATTDKATVINLSSHVFFNLKGAETSSSIQDLILQVYADTCVVYNNRYSPSDFSSVEGTPFDFREPHRVDYGENMVNEQLATRGFAPCWFINGWDGTLRKVADLYDPISGRGVETWSTEPALHIFTGWTLDGTIEGKYGKIQKYAGILLETIHCADSPNHPELPSTILRPGEKYYSTTEYRFYKSQK